MESLPPDQALSVVAHELAHARHDDVAIGTTLGALGAALAIGMLGIALSGRIGHRFGPMADPRVVPLVLALATWATLLASPVESAISRRIETRADVVALQATADSAAFIEMQRTLALRSLADPTPPGWVRVWWGSHPTTLERIALTERLGP